MLYYSSSNNSISGNNITNKWFGIYLYNSSYNSISGNNIANNGNGIWLWDSSHNRISGNNIMANNGSGIFLDTSDYNSISGNNITNNREGIRLSSSNNRIYHNNFIDNEQQVYSISSTNVWDDGYPSGGNYWSDYSGNDTYSGPYQSVTGADGIGDTPYIIDAENQDRYPFMNPIPDFSLTASPTSLTIQQGSSNTSAITITSIGGFNRLIQLKVSGIPSGVTITLSPEQAIPLRDGSTTSSLTVSVSATATPGRYTLTLTGTSGTLTHSVKISLEITASGFPMWVIGVAVAVIAVAIALTVVFWRKRKQSSIKR